MDGITSGAGIPKPVGPYTPAIKSGGLVFCSGQIGINPETGKFVEGGLEAQTSQVLENLKSVLVAAGSSLNRVVMTTIFLTDIAQGKVVNEIYARYVSTALPPARQTIAVKDLPMGALVEISVIAEC